MPGMGGPPQPTLMAQATPPPALGQQPAQQPSKVDANAKPAANPEYTDAQIKAWELIAKDPDAKQTGYDEVFKQKIADRRARLAQWSDMVKEGYPVEKITAKDRASLVQYMKQQGLHPEFQRLKPEYVSGLNVLHTNMFGSAPYRTEGGKGAEGLPTASKGLIDYVYVLDSEISKWKIAAVPELIRPDDHPGMVSTLFSKAKFASIGFTDDEKHFIIMLNRAIGSINALRTVTGLPRATQQLMDRYILELPNVIMDDSKTATIKLLTIQREIEAALKKSSSSSPMTPSPEQQRFEAQQPPPPEGTVPE